MPVFLFGGLREALKRNDWVFKVKILVSLDQFRLGTFKTFSHLLTPSSSKNAKSHVPQLIQRLIIVTIIVMASYHVGIFEAQDNESPTRIKVQFTQRR